MNEQCYIKLYHLLSFEDYVSARVLSEALDISPTTVRMRIRELSDYLRPYGVEIERKSGCGFRMNLVQRQSFEAFHENVLAGGSSPIPQTARDRAEYILDYLLAADSYVKINELESVLFLSSKTLSGYLKAIERSLEKYGLSIQRKPYHGLMVRGEEFQFRNCCMGRMLARGNMVISDQLWQNEEMRNIFICLNKCFQIYGYQTSDISFQDLVICVSVIIQRIRGMHLIKPDSQWDYYIYANQVFRIAQEIASQLEKTFSVQFPSEEIDYLALQLAGRRRVESDTAQDSLIGEKAKLVADRVIHRICEDLGFDFTNDINLKKSLISYLVPMEIRLRFGLRQRSPFVESTKGQFPLAYELAVLAVREIGDYYGCTVEEDEISSLTMAFELALERYKSNLPRKNILLICSSGNLAVEWLRYKYKEELRLYIDQVYTCDIRGIDSFDLSNVDYIFSSEALPETNQKPYTRIQYIFDDRDFYDNCRLMRKILDAGSQGSYERYFSPELFFPEVRTDTVDEAIRFLCSRVQERIAADGDLYHMVCERNDFSSLLVLHQVTVLQTMRSYAGRTSAAVAILKEPVHWNGRPLQMLILLINGREDNARLHSFYQSLYRMLKNERMTRKLVGAEDYVSFYTFFSQFGEELFSIQE